MRSRSTSAAKDAGLDGARASDHPPDAPRPAQHPRRDVRADLTDGAALPADCDVAGRGRRRSRLSARLARARRASTRSRRPPGAAIAKGGARSRRASSPSSAGRAKPPPAMKALAGEMCARRWRSHDDLLSLDGDRRLFRRGLLAQGRRALDAQGDPARSFAVDAADENGLRLSHRRRRFPPDRERPWRR